MVALALLLSCHKPVVDLFPGVAPLATARGPEEQPAVPASPLLRIDEYIDPVHGFSVVVPDGWVATAGRVDSSMRVQFNHEATGTVVNIWTYAPDKLSPRPLEDCEWGFVDHAYHHSVALAADVTVATCTPYEAGEPRVFATIVPRENAAFHLEVHVPDDHLVDGKAAGDALLEGLRW